MSEVRRFQPGFDPGEGGGKDGSRTGRGAPGELNFRLRSVLAAYVSGTNFRELTCPRTRSPSVP